MGRCDEEAGGEQNHPVTECHMEQGEFPTRVPKGLEGLQPEMFGGFCLMAESIPKGEHGVACGRGKKDPGLTVDTPTV